MNSPRKRLDALLVERGLASGRERAKEQIRAGHVRVDGRPETKPSTLVNAGAVLICEGGCPYVGRGGLKLEKAVREAPLALAGLTALDIGASTGGFTDCMLQNGAVRVYAVDVGHGQLHASLCEDPRVICLEGTDARSRELAAAVPAGTVQLVTADVSFISEKAVLPAVLPYLAPSARLVVLIKPQFEAGRQAVGRRTAWSRIPGSTAASSTTCWRFCWGGTAPRLAVFFPCNGWGGEYRIPGGTDRTSLRRPAPVPGHAGGS